MTQQRTFLTAEWRNLVMLNYAVDPALLRPFVPTGTEIDEFEGKTYASLVGFEFNNTRLRGVAIPFHRSFEEVNLRFYVRREAKRGVVFIRELVPKYAVAAIARIAFGENYTCVPMSHRIETDSGGDIIEAVYAWGPPTNLCTLEIKTAGPGFLPTDGSLSQFITEHYWGYAAQLDGGSVEYEVRHPQWRVRTARSAEFSGDAARYYGDALGRAVMLPPDSAFLAEGSEVSVFKGTRIA
jgi:uncharacterized protein YqjF (DUF2071 family)